MYLQSVLIYFKLACHMDPFNLGFGCLKQCYGLSTVSYQVEMDNVDGTSITNDFLRDHWT